MVILNRGGITAAMRRLRVPNRAIEQDAAGQPVREEGLDPCLKSLFLLQSRRARELESSGGFSRDLHSYIYHALCASFLAYRAVHDELPADVADGKVALKGHSEKVTHLQGVVTEHFQGLLDRPQYEIRALVGAQLAPTTFVRHEHTLYVSCRGTTSRRDWLADFDAQLVAIDNEWLPGTGKVHAGFHRAFQGQVRAVLDQIAREKVEDEITQVVFCGHSLGGAVAQLLGLAYSKKQDGTSDDHCAHVVTFGSPRVGDTALGELLDVHTHHLRLFVAKDPVAGVPSDATLTMLAGYDDHAAKEHWKLKLQRAAESSTRRAPDVRWVVAEFILHNNQHRITTYTNALIDHHSIKATERNFAATAGQL